MPPPPRFSPPYYVIHELSSFRQIRFLFTLSPYAERPFSSIQIPLPTLSPFSFFTPFSLRYRIAARRPITPPLCCLMPPAMAPYRGACRCAGAPRRRCQHRCRLRLPLMPRFAPYLPRCYQFLPYFRRRFDAITRHAEIIRRYFHASAAVTASAPLFSMLTPAHYFRLFRLMICFADIIERITYFLALRERAAFNLPLSLRH